MTILPELTKIASLLKEEDQLMPVLFIGHGSPMNAIEDNIFSRGWKEEIKKIVKPKAILCISAHWETNGTYITAMEKPKTIHDFGGFPQALFDAQYPAPGSKALADETKSKIASVDLGLNYDWGLDHGCWSVLKQIYPEADIPVLQLSLDYTKDANYHFNLAKELQFLRKKGVLIVGSGNMVHNFQYADYQKSFNIPNALDWATEANEDLKKQIIDQNYQTLIQYKKHSKAFQLAAPTPEHYLPMLYSIALRKQGDKLHFFNDTIVGGSFSMTSIFIGQ
ncbi:MAG: 4,5-DOPA dioxygenase extradiol [Saprospiraceae bacterium]